MVLTLGSTDLGVPFFLGEAKNGGFLLVSFKQPPQTGCFLNQRHPLLAWPFEPHSHTHTHPLRQILFSPHGWLPMVWRYPKGSQKEKPTRLGAPNPKTRCKPPVEAVRNILESSLRRADPAMDMGSLGLVLPYCWCDIQRGSYVPSKLTMDILTGPQSGFQESKRRTAYDIRQFLNRGPGECHHFLGYFAFLIQIWVWLVFFEGVPFQVVPEF